MRGGWGLDALGKFLRCRRRRRRCRRRQPGFGKWAVIGFRYDFGASGVRASMRLVFRVPKVILKTFKFRKAKYNIKKRVEHMGVDD